MHQSRTDFVTDFETVKGSDFSALMQKSEPKGNKNVSFHYHCHC